jgi:hypothetical protein
MQHLQVVSPVAGRGLGGMQLCCCLLQRLLRRLKLLWVVNICDRSKNTSAIGMRDSM